MKKNRRKYFYEYYYKNRLACLRYFKRYRDKISHTEKYKIENKQRTQNYLSDPINRIKARLSSKKNFHYKKRLCIENYGKSCYCCGESIYELLTLDHINNDGSKHRKELKTSTMWSWACKNNFPKDSLRLSCYNCNLGRNSTKEKICPHQTVSKN